MSSRIKWRAGNEEAERRADALKARFARVSRTSLSPSEKKPAFYLIWVLLFALLGFFLAAFLDGL